MSRNKPALAVLTGAGISAESGLTTFRDSGGLWAEHRIEDVCTPEAWARNPQLVLDFYNARRRAAEVLVSGSQARLVRRRETVEEMLANEQACL